MKFLVPNYSCLQNPWLRGYRPQIPILSVLNWICWTPPEKDSWVRHWWLGYGWTSEQNHDSFPIKHPDQGLGATCSSQWVLGTISLVHEVDHSFSNVTSLCVSLALSWVMCRDNFVCFFLYINNRVCCVRVRWHVPGHSKYRRQSTAVYWVDKQKEDVQPCQ